MSRVAWKNKKSMFVRHPEMTEEFFDKWKTKFTQKVIKGERVYASGKHFDEFCDRIRKNPDNTDRKNWHTAACLAVHLGVTPQNVLRMASEGAPRNQDGSFTAEDFVDWCVANYPNGAVAKSVGRQPNPTKKVDGTKKSLESIRASKLQFELDLKKGMYVPIEEVERFYARTCGYANTILGELAQRIDGNLPDECGEHERAVIRSVIEDTVRECLNSVAELVEGDTDDLEAEVDDDE